MHDEYSKYISLCMTMAVYIYSDLNHYSFIATIMGISIFSHFVDIFFCFFEKKLKQGKEK